MRRQVGAFHRIVGSQIQGLGLALVVYQVAHVIGHRRAPHLQRRFRRIGTARAHFRERSVKLLPVCGEILHWLAGCRVDRGAFQSMCARVDLAPGRIARIDQVGWAHVDVVEQVSHEAVRNPIGLCVRQRLAVCGRFLGGMGNGRGRGDLRQFFNAELRNHLQLAVVVKLKVINAQVIDDVAFSVAHNHGHRDQIDAGFERDRCFFRIDFPGLRLQQNSPGNEGEQGDADRESAETVHECDLQVYATTRKNLWHTSRRLFLLLFLTVLGPRNPIRVDARQIRIANRRRTRKIKPPLVWIHRRLKFIRAEDSWLLAGAGDFQH